MSPEQRRSLPSRLVGTVVNLVLVAATLLAVAFLLPSLLGYERYVITGGSMSGSIEKGSVVFSRPVPVGDLQVGDVITYLPPAESGVGTLVTHRITSIADEGGRTVLRTQGDANPDPDPWKFHLVEQEQPVVEHVVPVVGYGLIALADPGVRRLVIAVPAGLVALVALGQLIGALRSRDEQSANCGTPVEVVGSSRGVPSTSIDTTATTPSRGRHLGNRTTTRHHGNRHLTTSHSR